MRLIDCVSDCQSRFLRCSHIYKKINSIDVCFENCTLDQKLFKVKVPSHIDNSHDQPGIT